MALGMTHTWFLKMSFPKARTHHQSTLPQVINCFWPQQIKKVPLSRCREVIIHLEGIPALKKSWFLEGLKEKIFILAVHLPNGTYQKREMIV